MKNKSIQSIIETLYNMNTIERPHSVNVADISGQIARVMGLPEYEIKQISLAGRLHDIGKAFINPCIINKTGKLTDNEWFEVKKHPEIGYEVLVMTSEFSDIAEYVRGHHEKWDGSGYPLGLKAGQIPLPARIITIADAFDAMVTKRSYKHAYSVQEAVKEIRLNAGIQFDPSIAEIFVDIYMPSYLKLKDLLSWGIMQQRES